MLTLAKTPRKLDATRTFEVERALLNEEKNQLSGKLGVGLPIADSDIFANCFPYRQELRRQSDVDRGLRKKTEQTKDRYRREKNRAQADLRDSKVRL